LMLVALLAMVFVPENKKASAQPLPSKAALRGRRCPVLPILR